MDIEGIVWIVAYREDGGPYESDGEVYFDFDDAVHAACELQKESPVCDPRVIQVILDPAHMMRVLARATAALEVAAAQAPNNVHAEGVKVAQRIVEELAHPLGVAEVEEGGAL